LESYENTGRWNSGAVAEMLTAFFAPPVKPSGTPTLLDKKCDFCIPLGI
jgi:hypothetical protein